MYRIGGVICESRTADGSAVGWSGVRWSRRPGSFGRCQSPRCPAACNRCCATTSFTHGPFRMNTVPAICSRGPESYARVQTYCGGSNGAKTGLGVSISTSRLANTLWINHSHLIRVIQHQDFEGDFRSDLTGTVISDIITKWLTRTSTNTSPQLGPN